MTQQQLQQQLEQIAAKFFYTETLETRNSDSLDFHEVSVWGIADALKAAYELGQQNSKS